MKSILRYLILPTSTAFIFLAVGANAEQHVEPPTFDHSDAISVLGKAAEYFDELSSLPESNWLKRDQESANQDIDEMIEEAIEILNVPELTSMRQQYRDVEDEIRDEKHALAELSEKRVLAPDVDASTLTQWTPTETLKNFTATTRGDFDILIEARQQNIDGYQQQLKSIRDEMSAKLALIGLDMPPDQLEIWLSSAIGDDVISMGVIFNSIRTITLRLEELTQETGENLAFAKRYYGMVVILHRLVVHMQQSFISHVDDEILPKLSSYEEEANNIIADSERLIREGANRTSLEHNIEANNLTKRAIALYKRIVTDQRNKVAAALRISQREQEVAINTYRTVSLSASVASLIREGARTFETLSNLQVPDAAVFQNAEIREEFRKLTDRLESSQ